MSRLEIKPEEAYIKDQLAQAAEYVEVLKELNTNNVPPTYQVNNKSNVLREDIVEDSLPQDIALSQAQNSTNGYFIFVFSQIATVMVGAVKRQTSGNRHE